MLFLAHGLWLLKADIGRLQFDNLKMRVHPILEYCRHWVTIHERSQTLTETRQSSPDMSCIWWRLAKASLSLIEDVFHTETPPRWCVLPSL